MSSLTGEIAISCVAWREGAITVEAASALESARCPRCGQPSVRVHDRYRRRPLDLPWQGQTVRLVLQTRRFVCENRRCQQGTFGEDFGGILPRYARRTEAATAQLRTLVRRIGGEAAARQAADEGLPISPDTLLRLAHHTQGEDDACDDEPPASPAAWAERDAALRGHVRLRPAAHPQYRGSAPCPHCGGRWRYPLGYSGDFYCWRCLHCGKIVCRGDSDAG